MAFNLAYIVFGQSFDTEIALQENILLQIFEMKINK